MAVINSFEMFVSHGQVAFFDSRIDKPFNHWTDRHVKQGFAWRPGSVSFRTLTEGGKMNFEFIAYPEKYFAREDAIRSISVPFSCPRHGKVEIATITESHKEQLKQGPNQIIFETGKDGPKYWVRLTAIGGGNQEPAILVKDSGTVTEGALLMKASPAG